MLAVARIFIHSNFKHMRFVTMKCLILFYCALIITSPVVVTGADIKQPKTIRIEVPSVEASNLQQTRKSWEQEPTAVLGIRFGAPVKGQMQPCPVEMNDFDRVVLWDKTTETCYDDKPLRIGYNIVYNLPKAIRWGGGSIKLYNGNIESLSVGFKHEYYHELRALLIEKYGKPTNTIVKDYKNLAGATFTGEGLMWQGTNIYMKLREYEDSLNKSVFFVETNSFYDYRQKEDRKNAKSSLDKL
jgi:hypothetical protein